MTLTFSMNTGQLFCKRSLNLGMLDVLSRLYVGYAYGQEFHVSDIKVILLFSAHHLRKFMRSIYLITGDGKGPSLFSSRDVCYVANF